MYFELPIIMTVKINDRIVVRCELTQVEFYSVKKKRDQTKLGQGNDRSIVSIDYL